MHNGPLAIHPEWRKALLLILLPIPIMTIAAFVASVAMALAQAANGGLALWHFGNFEGTGFISLVWWVAFALTALGVLALIGSLISPNSRPNVRKPA